MIWMMRDVWKVDHNTVKLQVKLGFWETAHLFLP